MIHVYLNASALVKRFRHEIGSKVVNDTIDRVSADDPRRLVVSALTTLETLAILIVTEMKPRFPCQIFYAPYKES